MEVLRLPGGETQGTSYKKQLAAFAKFARGEGGLPSEIIEADIAERFGWTFSELDNEDVDRVYTGFALQNVRDSVSRVRSWLDHAGKIHLNKDDLELFGNILDADKELSNG